MFAICPTLRYSFSYSSLPSFFPCALYPQTKCSMFAFPVDIAAHRKLAYAAIRPHKIKSPEMQYCRTRSRLIIFDNAPKDKNKIKKHVDVWIATVCSFFMPKINILFYSFCYFENICEHCFDASYDVGDAVECRTDDVDHLFFSEWVIQSELSASACVSFDIILRWKTIQIIIEIKGEREATMNVTRHDYGVSLGNCIDTKNKATVWMHLIEFSESCLNSYGNVFPFFVYVISL